MSKNTLGFDVFIGGYFYVESYSLALMIGYESHFMATLKTVRLKVKDKHLSKCM